MTAEERSEIEAAIKTMQSILRSEMQQRAESKMEPTELLRAHLVPTWMTRHPDLWEPGDEVRQSQCGPCREGPVRHIRFIWKGPNGPSAIFTEGDWSFLSILEWRGRPPLPKWTKIEHKGDHALYYAYLYEGSGCYDLHYQPKLESIMGFSNLHRSDFRVIALPEKEQP